MTTEEIKKIAEEYAYRNNSNPNPPHCPEEELTKRLTEAFVAGAQFLTARYYLVEKGKVESKRDAIKLLKEVGYQDRLNLLDSLFGPDIRKEEEE